MPKRPTKASASSTRAFSSGFGSSFGPSGFSSNASSLSYVWEPPDLSTLSDPTLVVAFKSISKKDGTTKAKGLEEIQSYVAASENIEDAVLEIWVQFYPRLSIDAARRVRQLAHTVQGNFCVAVGKRFAKHMPNVVGAWLCGTFDTDRAAAKAAQNALNQMFPSAEKLLGVRKAYQASILDFCQNVIDSETPQTLSDERSSSPDDVEAKYNRLIASVVLLVTSLLQELPPDDTNKYENVYLELLQDESLWKLSCHSDPNVRRAVHRLLRICVVRRTNLIQSAMPVIGASYVGHGLRSDQTGTSLDFLEALIAVVNFDIAIWSENAKGSKSVSRLCSFFKRGSQLAPSDYWPNLVSLLQRLPREAYAPTLKDAQEVLNAIATGIRRKDEPRTNLPAAWRAYVHVAELLLEDLMLEDMHTLISNNISPILEQYVRPSEDTLDWDLPKLAASSVIEQLLDLASIRAVIAEAWSKSTEQLLQVMKASLPEQSKDFRQSQDRVAKQGERWAFIESYLLRQTSQEGEDLSELQQAATKLLCAALELLQNRNGKPYGAAALLSSALYTFKLDLDATAQVETFTKQKLPGLFCSPSAHHLADILYFFYDQMWFNEVWEETLQNILTHEPSLLSSLLSSTHVPAEFSFASTSPSLQNYIEDQAQRALSGESDWGFLDGLANSNSQRLAGAIVNDALLVDLTKALSLDSQAPQALDGLHALMKTDRKAVEAYLQQPEASKLLPRLLFLGESADEEIAHSALNLNSLVQNGLSSVIGGSTSHETLSKTIRAGLLEASDTSLSIDALSRLSLDFISRQHSQMEPETAVQLLPSVPEWQTALNPFLELTPLSSLSIISPIGGAVHLVEATSTARDSILRLPRETEGQSAALRMICYVNAILPRLSISTLPRDVRVEYARLFCWSLVLANDNLSVGGANHLWSQYTPEMDKYMATLVSAMQNTIHSWMGVSQNGKQDVPEDSREFIQATLDRLWIDSKGVSPISRISAEAYAYLMAAFTEVVGDQPTDQDNIVREASKLRKEGEYLQLAALLHSRASTLAPTTVGSRWRGELVAELTSSDIAVQPQACLQMLVLLNILFANLPDGAQGIAKQRTIYFMRHVLPWLQTSPSHACRAEIYRSLGHLMPNITDLYGEHWTQLLGAMTEFWSNTSPLDAAHPEQQHELPTIYHAVRLYTVVTSATIAEQEDSNEDLADAVRETQQQTADAFFHLLSLSQACPDEYNQPLRMVNELVTRRIRGLPSGVLPGFEAIYPLLTNPSEYVQQVAYDSVHKRIPELQEQISLEAALEKRSVKLPEELISLILEAPTVQDLEDAPWDRGIPLPLRGYLLSWLLVFDHFGNASYKVRNDYLESLKEVSPLPALLGFTFDFLGHRRGKPIDASKIDVTKYDGADSTGDPKADCQQLLSHIYFLALQYTPSLVKAWWIDLRARALVSSVEAWTEKYISPHIVAGALASVQQWAAEQSDPSNPDAAPSGERLKIAVSQRASEVRASYDIDEQTLAITIRLPGAWPLAQAVVAGTSRVGVSEAKWQSWVRGCQGVISFSNGSVVDGLVAFRRNVVGAMKGQTECAICYSVISSDKQLPSKRCGTCKNLFHSGCLFRWFKTSNASTCPLCRNPFNYG